MLTERLLTPLHQHSSFLCEVHVSETPQDVLLWKSCLVGAEIAGSLNFLNASLKNDINSLICHFTLSMSH